MTRELFLMTAQHIRLLRCAYVGWDEAEFGAPCIDTKRPYGNSDGVADVARVLGYSYVANDRAATDSLEQLHRETMIALQIVLVVGEFKTGLYEKTDRYRKRSWVRIGDAP